MRLSKDDYYLGIAKAVCQRSTCLRRKYGAVIVNNKKGFDMIVGTGYNGSPRGSINCCDKKNCKRQDLNIPPGERYELCEAVHSEVNACQQAGDRAIGATLYLYGEEIDGSPINEVAPCALCSKIIKNSGIKRIVTSTHKFSELKFAYMVS